MKLTKLMEGMMHDNRRYSIVPIRATSLIKKGRTWRVLASLCSYTSPSGICFPNQRTIEEMCNVEQAHVSRAIKELYEVGLLRYLLPIGKPHKGSIQRGNRYQILYDEYTPSDIHSEIVIAPGSRTGRW